MTRTLRFLAAAGLGLLTVLALAGGAGWLWLRTSLPQTEGDQFDPVGSQFSPVQSR